MPRFAFRRRKAVALSGVQACAAESRVDVRFAYGLLLPG